jgi:mannose-6-phosphate isomerase-like protein (cupin superfamily)
MKQNPKIIKKPWGEERLFAHNEHYAGKVLYIRAGKRLSLQYHKEKIETLYLQHGDARVLLNEKTIMMKAGNIIHIPANTKHRIEAITMCTFIEVSTPQLDDAVRLTDDYGREEIKNND